MRPALAACALGASVASTIFSSAAGAPPPRIVHVDLVASDARGRMIDNLKAGDVEILENGAVQPIDGLRFIRADGREPGGAEPAPIRSEFDEQEEAGREGTRLFGMLLDEYHVAAGAETTHAREALVRFLDHDLGPRDLVAVVKPLDSLLTIRVTRDHDAIRNAIDTFEGRRGDYEPRTPFERNYIAGSPARIDQVRAQVAASALNALVIHLGKLSEARKSVVIVSGGFGRSARRRGLEGLPTVDSVIRAANRYNVSIYPIDPRAPESPSDGDKAAERDAADLDTLRALADGTDGRAAIAGVNAADTIHQMMIDASAYYVLTYRSVQPNDGKFRTVQVRVKRSGAQVRARKGYWALWPDEALAAEMLSKTGLPPAPPLPAAFAMPARTSPLIRPWFGLSRSNAGKTRVTFIWEPAPRIPGDRSRAGRPDRIVFTAFAPDGSQLYDGTVCSAGQPTCPADRAVFDAAPGRIRLRMSIEDAGETVLDSDVREILVRDFKGPVALGTAEILRTRTARQFRAVDGDPAAAPAAAREFSRTEHLIVRFPVYSPEGNPQVFVRLVNRVGQTLRELPVETPAAPDGRYQADLALANLAPSEYFFEVSATSPAGEAKDLIGFRVTN